MANRIQLRRDTTHNWNSVDPILADGEPGYDIVTNEIRIGDGSKNWSQLSGNTISGSGGVPTEIYNSVGSATVVSQGYTWQFSGAAGVLTLPRNNYLETSDANLKIGSQANVTIRSNASTVGGTHTWNFHKDGSLALPNALDQCNSQIYTTNGGYQTRFETFNTGTGLGTGQKLTLDYDDASVKIQSWPGKEWKFGQYGDLTLPGGGTITEANVGVADALILTPANVSYSDQQLRIYSTGQPADANHLHLTTGNLHTSELYLGDDNYFVKLNNNGNIQIRAATQSLSATASWMFSTDGKLAFPNNSAFDGQTLTDHATGANYTLKIANGGVAGSKFAIGTGSASFGIANDALNHAEDGYVPYSVTASRINLTVLGAGSWVFDNTGNLTVPGNLILPAGGQIQSPAGTGNVTIEANDGNNVRAWAFETNGNITFPDATTQGTAYQRTTGSWTVPVGSSNRNFTVPQTGTYTMWVRGTCDNGIITWNATATVTNNNVPVTGQQYAWVYSGAGTPIDFTDIPHQFVGTANTIVRSNPSVTGPTNRFDFVINNTSGSEQTVYWGYVAQ